MAASGRVSKQTWRAGGYFLETSQMTKCFLQQRVSLEDKLVLQTCPRKKRLHKCPSKGCAQLGTAGHCARLKWNRKSFPGWSWNTSCRGEGGDSPHDDWNAFGGGHNCFHFWSLQIELSRDRNEQPAFLPLTRRSEAWWAVCAACTAAGAHTLLPATPDGAAHPRAGLSPAFTFLGRLKSGWLQMNVF